MELDDGIDHTSQAAIDHAQPPHRGDTHEHMRSFMSHSSLRPQGTARSVPSTTTAVQTQRKIASAQVPALKSIQTGLNVESAVLPTHPPSPHMRTHLSVTINQTLDIRSQI